MAAVNSNNGAFKSGYDSRRFYQNGDITTYHQKLGALLRTRSLEAVDYIQRFDK